jgi:hypothetical protein
MGASMMFLPIKRSGFLSQPINALIDYCLANTIVNSPDIIRVEKGNGVALHVTNKAFSQQGFPWGSDHPWGLVSISGAVVTIAAGEFECGNGVALSTAETSFTITADQSYIGLRYDPATPSLSFVGPVQDKPLSFNGYFQVWLYLIAFDGTSASYVKHNLTGAWHGALYAATVGS